MMYLEQSCDFEFHLTQSITGLEASSISNSFYSKSKRPSKLVPDCVRWNSNSKRPSKLILNCVGWNPKSKKVFYTGARQCKVGFEVEEVF
jgi:hypothetical protein